MRHILTMLIAFHWMTVFAMLAIVSTVDPEHGVLAALRFLGAVPLPEASDLGGGPVAAAFLAVVFAVASVLFLWTLLTVSLGDGPRNRLAQQRRRLAGEFLAGARQADDDPPAIFRVGRPSDQLSLFQAIESRGVVPTTRVWGPAARASAL